MCIFGVIENMARTRNNTPQPPQPNRINWLNFFQSIDNKYVRLGIFSGIISIGFGAGYFSSSFIKDREIVLLERNYNKLDNERNLEKIQFETEKSNYKVELNEMKILLINTKDSLRNARKK